MATIASLRKEMEKKLSAVPGYEEYRESAWTMRGDKIILGRHITVAFSVDRPIRAVQDQVVRILRKYFHGHARRHCHSRGHTYSWNENVKSELIIVF